MGKMSYKNPFQQAWQKRLPGYRARHPPTMPPQPIPTSSPPQVLTPPQDEKPDPLQGPIADFPQELLSHIFSFLPQEAEEINRVRSLCRAFRSAAWPTFAESFNRRVFHLLGPSLDCLVQLAENEKVAPYIRRLNFSTVCFVDPSSTHKPWVDWQLGRSSEGRDSRDHLVENFMRLARADFGFDGGNGLGTKLTMALKKLDHVAEIVVVDGESLRHFYGIQGGETEEERKARKEVHQAHKQGAGFLNASARARTMALLVQAVRESQAGSRLQTMEMRCSVDVRHLPSTQHHETPNPVFSGLQCLQLSVDVPGAASNLDESFSPSYKDALCPFLAGMPALTKLDLTFPNLTDRSNQVRVVHWLSGKRFANFCALHFDKLVKLRMANLGLGNSRGFKEFLHAHRKTLKRLHFFNLRMFSEDWRPFANLLCNCLELDRLEIRDQVDETVLGPEEGDEVPQEVWKQAAKKVVMGFDPPVLGLQPLTNPPGRTTSL